MDNAHGPDPDSFCHLALRYQSRQAEKQASKVAHHQRLSHSWPQSRRSRPVAPARPAAGTRAGASQYGLSRGRYGLVVQYRLAGGVLAWSLREILDLIRDVYVGTIGSEVNMHINDTAEVKRWIQRLRAARPA